MKHKICDCNYCKMNGLVSLCNCNCCKRFGLAFSGYQPITHKEINKKEKKNV